MKTNRRLIPFLPRLMMALAASVVTIGAGAEPQQIKLVVGIVVDGLDGDCLDLLEERFGAGGFRLMGSRGTTFNAVDYGTPVNGTAAAAMVMTGASPSVNGIAGDEVFDALTLTATPTFADAQVMGNFASKGFSPRAMRVSTVSDEARIASGGISSVYAVAPTAARAMILGGHSGTLALWFNPRNGQWASSTYFSEIPTAIAARNRAQPLEMRMDTMSWTPSASLEGLGLPEHLTRYPFRYVFPRESRRIERFMASPLANREITNLAIDILGTMRPGRSSDGVDVLNIAYSLTPFDYGRNSDARAEQLDAYLRLDNNLEQLFSAVERNVGLDHALIYLAGTPPRPYSRRDEERWGIPYGEFSTRRAASLLNIYLIALHGNGDYVSGYHGGYIFLNRRLLKERDIDLATVRREAAEFMARMTGVAAAYTLDDILAGRAGDNSEALRRNTVATSAGDVLVTVAPGYHTVDDLADPTSAGSDAPVLVHRAGITAAPAFIMGPGVVPATIGTPVDVRTLAPTVARILRIRSPNGASLAPVPLSGAF